MEVKENTFLQKQLASLVFEPFLLILKVVPSGNTGAWCQVISGSYIGRSVQ